MPTNFLSNHFADTRRRITPAEIAKQRFLVLGVPFQRWMLLPAAALIQMSVGSFYAWSVYNAPIARAMNEGRPPPIDPAHAEESGYVTKEQIAETFYCAVAFFGVAACLSGPWLERHGPRRMSLIGASLFFVGHLLSALAVHTQITPLLFVGYGFCGGLGIGMSYLVPVAVLQQWFPDKKGFSAGVSVGSFGLGSVIASFSQAALLSVLGPKLTFLVLGCVYFSLHAVCSFVLRFPPPDHAPAGMLKAPLPHGTASPATAADAAAHAGSAAHAMEHAHAKDGTKPEHQTLEVAVSGRLTNNNVLSGSTADLTDRAGHEHDAHDELVADPLARLHHGADDQEHPHVHPESVPLHKMDFIDELTSIDFRYVYMILFLAAIPGLVIVSRVADMVVSAFGQTVATSTWVVGVNGMCNVLGRFVAGVMSDKMPRLLLMTSFIIVTIAVMGSMYAALMLNLFPLFIFSMWTLTACYGGACAIIPSILGDVFGSGHIGALYGVTLTGWAAGGVIGGVGFTALINSQRASGVAAQHVYDFCIFSMIPMSAIGIAVVAMFAMRRRNVARDIKHPLPGTGGAVEEQRIGGAEAGRAVGALEMQRITTDKSVSSITGGRYPVHHSLVRHPPAHL